MPACIEIECKCRIGSSREDESVCAVEQRLHAISLSRIDFFYEDKYYRLVRDTVFVDVRIRRKSHAGTILCTYKRKTLRDGIEHNAEYEWEISDSSAYEVFLQDSGFTLFIHKEKYGSRYKLPTQITVEIVTVPPLGVFAEIEHCTKNEFSNESPNELRSENIRINLLRVLHKLGIDTKHIEPRYYTEMLAEHRAKEHR